MFPNGIVHIHPAEGELSPIVVSNPHSGTLLPDLFRYACENKDLLRESDLYMDEILKGIPALGIPVIEFLPNRAYIDPNRHADEIDPVLLSGPWTGSMLDTPNVERGLGVFFRRTFAGQRDIYAPGTKFTPDEVAARISANHTPYHNALAAHIDAAIQKHGYCILADMHSMDPVTGYKKPPRIILGTRNDTTASAKTRREIKSFFERNRFKTLSNKIYSGQEIVRRHGNPPHIEAIQIELTKDSYMDPETLERKPEKLVSIQHLYYDFFSSLKDYALKQAAIRKPQPQPGSQQPRTETGFSA